MLGDGKSVDCRVPNKHSDGEKTFGYDCNLDNRGRFPEEGTNIASETYGERFA